MEGRQLCLACRILVAGSRWIYLDPRSLLPCFAGLRVRPRILGLLSTPAPGLALRSGLLRGRIPARRLLPSASSDRCRIIGTKPIRWAARDLVLFWRLLWSQLFIRGIRSLVSLQLGTRILRSHLLLQPLVLWPRTK